MDIADLFSALCLSLVWTSCTGVDPNGGQLHASDRLHESTPATQQTAQEADLPIEVSPETTYFVEPRMADGRVDYAAAINRITSEGVTPENNASILMLHAFGPELLDPQWRAEYYQHVGMEPLATEGQWFVDIKRFAEQRGIDMDPPLDPELEPFREELMQMIREGGDSSEHPELSQALSELARRPPTERPRTLADHLDDATRKAWTAEDYPHLAEFFTDVMRQVNAKYDELVLVLQIDDFAQRQQHNSELWDDFEKTTKRYNSYFQLLAMAAQRGVDEVVTELVALLLMATLVPDPAILDHSRLRWQAERRLVMTALAVEQFRRRHGRLPEQLDNLLPEFLAQLPLDPFTGQSLYYRPKDGGYLLYSTGPNGRDNGGTRWQDASRRFRNADVVIEIRP